MRQIHLAFPEARKYLKIGAKTEVFDFGNPIQPPDFGVDRAAARARFELGGGTVCLVTGGSQGARAVNESLLSDIRGQNPAMQVLGRALTTDRLAHSYLFEGPSGVGKQKAALGLALSALCPNAPRKGCGTCNVCTRILGGNHPDVRVFRPRDEGARNLSVETVRETVLPVAQFAPFEGKTAFLIFPDADVSFPEVHPEAANALLKTLEEPRARVHFVLIAERPDRLLVTIRSRCQRVRFGRLPPLVLEHVLETAGVPQAEWEAAVALADGRADRALSLVQDGRGRALLEKALHIDTVIERGATGRLIELSEQLAKAEDLVAANGSAIRAVANALRLHRSLSAADVAHLVRTAAG